MSNLTNLNLDDVIQFKNNLLKIDKSFFNKMEKTKDIKRELSEIKNILNTLLD